MSIELDLQSRTLLTFLALMRTGLDWPGALIVAVGLGPEGTALAFAANIAGAACLVVEAEAAPCRTAMRNGAIDFLVNTVDESLRVLKNEIRQRKPLSVGLELAPGPALAELLERGVLPALFLAGQDAASRHAGQIWAGQGSRVDLDAPHLETMLVEFADGSALRAYDQQRLERLSPEDPMRAWYSAAPRLFHRDRPYRRAALGPA